MLCNLNVKLKQQFIQQKQNIKLKLQIVEILSALDKAVAKNLLYTNLQANMEDNQKQKLKTTFSMQPILCPWITSQPYRSSQQNKLTTSNQTNQNINQSFLPNSSVKSLIYLEY